MKCERCSGHYWPDEVHGNEDCFINLNNTTQSLLNDIFDLREELEQVRADMKWALSQLEKVD